MLGQDIVFPRLWGAVGKLVPRYDAGIEYRSRVKTTKTEAAKEKRYTQIRGSWFYMTDERLHLGVHGLDLQRRGSGVTGGIHTETSQSTTTQSMQEI
jgi:hypothetical protein